MDTVEQQLTQVEQYVADGVQLVLRQKELLAGLPFDGGERQEAEALLILFEELLEKRVSERNRLRKLIGAIQQEPSRQAEAD